MITADFYQLLVSVPLFAMACHGWGCILLPRGESGGLPFYAPVLGSAFLVVAGGFMGAAGVFHPYPAFALLLGGAGYGLLIFIRQLRALNPWILTGLLLPAAVLMLFTVNRFTLSDDNLAYIPLALDLIAQGTVDQPLCLRAGINPNGQAVAAAFSIVLGGIPAAAVYDVVPLAFALMLWASAAGHGDRAVYSVLAGGLLLAPYMAWNTAPTLWIAGSFIALYGIAKAGPSWRTAAAWALVVVAGYSLRGYWLLPLAGISLVLVARGLAPWKSLVRSGILSVLMVVPFLWLSYEQFGTPAALLYSGTLHPEMVAGSQGDTFSVMTELLQKPVFVFPVAVLVLLCVAGRQYALLLLVGTVCLLAIHHSNELTWHYPVRFLSGILYGTIALVSMGAFRWRKALVMGGGGLMATLGVLQQADTVTLQFQSLTSRVQERRAVVAGIPDAQSATAPGTTILTFVGSPMGHHFQRNRILLGDVPGGTAEPEWEGLDGLKSLGVAYGADYLMLSDPFASLSRPRYFPQIEAFLDIPAPFYRGRWSVYQVRLKEAVEEAIARGEGVRFRSVYLIPLENP